MMDLLFTQSVAMPQLIDSSTITLSLYTA